MTLRCLMLLVLLFVALAPTATASSHHLRELMPGVEIPATHARRRLATCDIEPGIDYLGNDVGSVSNRPVSACCSECDAHQGCGAWSWSNWNGGTCWLKSKKGQWATNSNVQSAELVATPPTCPITADTDYVGHDIANVLAKPAGACCEICGTWPGCNAFSWTDLNGGTCWLKSMKDQTVWNPNVQSGDVAGPPDCMLEDGVDYFDNDLDNVNGYSNPGACCGVCLSWSGCRAFSWTSLNGGTCWLKSRKGTTRDDPNVVSCAVLDNPDPSCEQETDIDYTDNDIGSVRNTDANNCCDICRDNGDCHAFSWSDHEGGTCWLKSTKGTPVEKTGVISGVV